MFNGNLNLTLRQIKQLPLTRKERDHRSRTRKGLHVYISYYFYLFSELTAEQQEEHIVSNNVRDDSDVISIADSTDTAYDNPNIKFEEVVRCAYRQWRYMSAPLKSAWEKRAESLNAMKLPGWILNLPPKLSTKSIVMESISLEWNMLVKVFKEAISRAPPAEERKLKYVFGKEVVELNTQTYKKFTMTLLLNSYLFGENYSKVRNEVCYESKTKNVTVLHIASQKRMQEIFTIEEQTASAFLYEKGSFAAIRTCCGKVQIVDGLGKKNIGFILEERRTFWKIKLKTTNDIIHLKKLTYNSEEGRYELNNFCDHNGRHITKYWPIRMYLTKKGNCRMTINRVGFGKNNAIIQSILFTS